MRNVYSYTRMYSRSRREFIARKFMVQLTLKDNSELQQHHQKIEQQSLPPQNPCRKEVLPIWFCQSGEIKSKIAAAYKMERLPEYRRRQGRTLREWSGMSEHGEEG